MSITLMGRVYAKDVEPHEQRVLLVLADHANEDGYCWPSLGLIAWKLGLAVKTVRRTMRSLEERGAVERHERLGKSNAYRVNLDALSDKPPYQPAGRPETPPFDGTPPAGGRPPAGDRPTPPAGGPDPSRPGETPLPHRREPEPSGNRQEEPPREPSGGAPKAPTRRPLPQDFAVTADMRDWARARYGVTDAYLDDETEAFTLHWTSTGDRKADWPATWKVWIRRSLERRAAPGRTPRTATVSRPDEDTAEHWFGRYAEGAKT